MLRLGRAGSRSLCADRLRPLRHADRRGRLRTTGGANATRRGEAMGLARLGHELGM